MLNNKNAGVGLIEVLVALLILAVGVLGFVAMQATSLKSSDDALSRTKALTLARDLVERMRNNTISDNATIAYYNALSTVPTAVNACTNGCTPAQLANNDAIHIAKSATNDAMQIKLVTCPGAVGAKLTSGMSSTTQALGNSCVIVAWANTTATIGAASPNCMNSTGTYLNDSNCVVLEAH